MTIQNQNQIDGNSAVSHESSVLDGDAFQARRSELQDFVAETHSRLQSLSKTLATAQCMPSGHEQTDQGMNRTETVASTPVHDDSTWEDESSCDDDPTGEIVQQPEQSIASPDNSVTGSPDTDTDTVTDTVTDTETETETDTDDPMERLNAIKRRLAHQMQNAT